MAGPELIYVMKELRKVVPPNREILKGFAIRKLPTGEFHGRS